MARMLSVENNMTQHIKPSTIQLRCESTPWSGSLFRSAACILYRANNLSEENPCCKFDPCFRLLIRKASQLSFFLYSPYRNVRYDPIKYWASKALCGSYICKTEARETTRYDKKYDRSPASRRYCPYLKVANIYPYCIDSHIWPRMLNSW